MSKNANTIHGIDPFQPGGIEALLDFHRQTFGDAVMEAGEGGEGGSEEPGAGAGGSATEPGANEPGEPKGGDELGEGGKKALTAEREARKAAEKAHADAQARIKELEDSTKSDEDKRNERFQQLEQSDREKDQQIIERDGVIERYRIAAKKGLDLEAAERLRGKTTEEIEKDADTWIAKWGSSKAPGAVPGAGQRGSDADTSTPGMGRLRNAYATSK